jgi:hypothetical protein
MSIVSSPNPELIVSRPGPPTIESLPDPLLIVSSPAPPSPWKVSVYPD